MSELAQIILSVAAFIFLFFVGIGIGILLTNSSIEIEWRKNRSEDSTEEGER